VTRCFHPAATYVDILKRARPGALPIELPTQFGLVVNRKVAMHLGVTVPSALLVQARRIVD
jgi:ABC-type uncharacterized transport system substrate-binding protein